MSRLVRIAALAAVLGCLGPAAASASVAPVLSGSVSSNTDLSATVSVAVSGHYAYTTAYQAGELTAVDISNPAAPAIAGHSLASPNLIGGSNVAISGGYAFVVSKNRNASPDSTPGNCTTGNNDDGKGNSLTILDIQTDPANPSIVGTVRDTGKLFGSYGIAVSSHYAYVAYQGLLGGQPCVPDTSTGGFSVIDISSPGLPAIVANIDNGSLPAPYTGQNLFDHSTSVQVAGHYAYVTAFNAANFTVIDISNPTSPQIVGTVHDNTQMALPVDIALQGNYAYVADQASGSSPKLTVVDISNPASPKIVATDIDAALNGAYRIRVRGDFAYLSGSSAQTISAVDISSPASPRTAGFVYDPNHLNKTTGLDLDPTGAYVVASSPYLPTESNTTYPPYPLQSGGPTATGTISVITLDPVAIAVSIASASEPPNPTAQTSASFSFSVNDTVSAVQCALDGAAFGACTSATTQTYTSLATGSHTFTVEAIDSTGHATSASYTWTIGSAPSNSGAAPSISGSTVAGSTLTAVAGGWSGSPAPTFSYQWNQCDGAGANCSPISGQTGSSYVTQPGDVGSDFTVSVTGTNGFGSSTVTSSAVGPVGTVPSNSGASPSASGSTAVGSTLSALTGGWSGSPSPTFSYQWNQCDASGASCSPIASATGPTYTVQPADAGHKLSVSVTGSNSHGSSTATSSAVGPAGTAPSNSGAPPSISGSPTSGSTLTASPGGWSGAPTPTYGYQWEQCSAAGTGCGAIAGATGQSYVVQPSDAGHTLTVAVTASNVIGSAGATPTAVGPVPLPPGVTGAPPSISGTGRVGQTLTAAPGAWSGSPTFTYQWLRCAATGGGCAAITSATGQTYLLAAPDAGHTIEVVVTGTNSSGSNSASSPPTGIIQQLPANTTAPSISGTAAVGRTLTASNGSWTGYPAPTLSDQWMRCNTAGESCVFTGATASSYKVSGADVGHALRVYVRGSNSAGSALARSGATAVVAPGTSAAAGGVGAGRAHLRVGVQAGSGTAAVRQVTITLPSGLAFAGRHLASAVKVTGPGGQHVKYTVALRAGTLVVTLRSAQSGLTITVATAGLTVASRLRIQVHRHPGSRVNLRLVVTSASGQLSRQTTSLALS